MIKVFLVEDEVIIRESVKNSIDWEKEGYEFAGEASDGELALPLILEEKPDIVITDIRMPFMDGLELSRIVKEKLPDTKIIILSGYDDFGYAKEAIKIGVTEYLLKPVSAAVLLEHLQEVADKIQKQQDEKEMLLVYQQEMQENEKLIKTKFLRELFSEEISLADALEKGKRFDIDLSARFFQILLFKYLQDNVSLQLFEEVEACEDKKDGIYVFERGIEGWAFLITSSNDFIEEKTAKLKNKLENISQKYSELDFFGGIGGVVPRIRELKKSFQDADLAFAARFVKNPNQIICKKDLHPVNQDDEFDVSSFDAVNEMQKIIEKFLENGAREEIVSFVQALFAEVSEEHFRSLMFRQYIIMNLYATVMEFCKRFKKEGTEKQLEDILQNEDLLKNAVMTVETIPDIEDYVVTLLQKAIDLRNTISGRRYSDIILTAQKLIREEYMSEEISLNVVAARVCMSPSYFSTIFSKETGKTFIEYLTEVRMEKAKEYLEEKPELAEELSAAERRKRAQLQSKPVYRYVALAIFIMGIVSAAYGLYAVTTHTGGYGIYFALFGFAAIFLFSSYNMLPTAHNNHSAIMKRAEKAEAAMAEYVKHYPNGAFPVPSHYAHPIVLKQMADAIEEGRAVTVPEALTAVENRLKSLNADVQVEQEEYDEVVVIKAMFLNHDYQ